LFRAKAAAALIAFSSLRPESLEDAEGGDELMIREIPEMVIDHSAAVKFPRTSELVIVSLSLSKAEHQYFSFLPTEGCEYL
jgi:hypothetical protein